MVNDPFYTGGLFNNILCRPVVLLQDAALNHYKPTLREAPHQWHHASAMPLLSSVSDQPSDDVSGFVSVSLRDLVVIWSFSKGLVVTLLL
jgi:hypothetical protein